MSSEHRKAQMRNYANERYKRMRINIGRYVHDGIINKPYLVKNNYAYVVTVKINIGECVDCGLICDEWTHTAFAFDHLNRKNKIAGVSEMVRRSKKYPLHVIQAEINKCELVCHCCHAFRTYYGGHHKDQSIRIKNVIEKQLTLF